VAAKRAPRRKYGPGQTQVDSGPAEHQISREHPSHASTPVQRLPEPTGRFPYRLELNEIFEPGRPEVVDDPDEIAFHLVGDTAGVQYPIAQHLVAEAMTDDLEDPEKAVDFCYHVGDLVYFNGERSQYFPQFYEPYRHYAVPMVAIPGNHDATPLDPAKEPSLSAFVRTFCSRAPQVLPEAQDAPRTTMIQPNVHWTLRAPLFTIIGLYTNANHTGHVDDHQASWFAGELEDAPTDRALIVALHHTPYSVDAHHGGSAAMGDMLDRAFQRTERLPDIVLAGHVHNYQRFTRTVEGRQIPYVVTGGSGFWQLHKMAKAADGSELKAPWPVPETDVVLEAFSDDRHGYGRVVVGRESITGSYTTVPRGHESWSEGPREVVDAFRIDLAKHTVETVSA
jgi:hypothetical protein